MKSLLFSAVLHVLIFSLFIFTFPLQKPSDKPSFVFLGPILKNQDVKNILTTNNPQASNKFSEDMVNKKFDMGKNPFAFLYLNKPQTQKESSANQKIDLKSTFDLTEHPPEDDKKEVLPSQDISIIDAIPYKPLKLQDE